jgi:sugar phosphate isomerase/epimerase
LDARRTARGHAATHQAPRLRGIAISGEPRQYETKVSRPPLKPYGIRCWGAVTLTLGERNLAAGNEAQRAKSVDYVKSVVTMVKELDGHECTIDPATVGKVVPDGTPSRSGGGSSMASRRSTRTRRSAA